MSISEAHKGALPHRVSAVFVFRPNGNLLLQVHKYYDGLLDHSVGGHVSAGENYEIAAKREMSEELRLNVPIMQVATGVLADEYYKKTARWTKHMFGIFEAKIDDAWEHVPTEEVDRVIEMSLDEVVSEMNKNPDKFLQGFLATMGAYLNSIGSDQKIRAYGKVWGSNQYE